MFKKRKEPRESYNSIVDPRLFEVGYPYNLRFVRYFKIKKNREWERIIKYKDRFGIDLSNDLAYFAI